MYMVTFKNADIHNIVSKPLFFLRSFKGLLIKWNKIIKLYSETYDKWLQSKNYFERNSVNGKIILLVIFFLFVANVTQKTSINTKLLYRY